MNLKQIVCLAIIVVVSAILCPSADSQNRLVRERSSLNAAWLFQKDDPAGTEGRLSYAAIKDWVNATGNEFTNDAKRTRPAGNLGSDVSYTKREFDDRGWRKLDLPHDWGIEGPFNQDYPGETGKLPWFGVAWYRKHIQISPSDKARRVYLQIDGAMAYSTVWLNGEFVGGWPYGYASFELDLTPYLQYGADNVIAIRLENPPESSRWYPGGGLYRNVWLVKTAPVHVGHWGTYITTPHITADSADVKIRTTVNNDPQPDAAISATTQVFEVSSTGQKIGKPISSSSPNNLQLAAGKVQTIDTGLVLSRPKLWDLKSPNRYLAISTVKQNGQVVDQYETVFGVRTIKFDEKEGFYLNGEHVYLKGVCDHHDLGALGSDRKSTRLNSSHLGISYA